MSATHVPDALRERVAAQARHRCGYCLSAEAIMGMSLEIEHTIPESRGGLIIEENLWLACPPCNARKSDRFIVTDPDTGELVRLFDPRHQVWSEHFQWNESCDSIVGVTPTGRATVHALELNRPVLVNARRLWVEAGWHPLKDS